MGQVAGKVVAITGGARGIGAATAHALADAGATIALGDLDADLAAKTASPYNGLGVELDVTSQESFTGFLDQVEERFGRVDVLVNNAGIMVIGYHLKVPLEDQLRQIDVNLRGVIIGSHTVAPRMAAAGGGHIINIASLAGRVPVMGGVVYSATKAAVISYSDALDAELTGTGVRVTSVLPTFTQTALIDGTEAPSMSPAIPPEDVARAVVKVTQKYRPVVTVPPRLAGVGIQMAVTPQRARRWMAAKAGLNEMFTEFDPEARQEYQERAARRVASEG